VADGLRQEQQATGANAVVIASPMPRLAPVTSTTAMLYHRLVTCRWGAHVVDHPGGDTDPEDSMIEASVVNGGIVEALREVQRPLVEANHAPGPLYASPEIYRLEVDRLFRRDWLLVGREEELPEPGDFMTPVCSAPDT
jgi:hypothetical protein